MGRGRREGDALELLRGEGEAKVAEAETTWKDGTRGEWHGVDHTLDEQFHGYRVKGSLPLLENLVVDVMYRFFFFFFLLFLSVMVISLSLLFWFNRLVFVLFRFVFSVFWLSWKVQGAKGDAIFPWNFRNEICFAYACLAGGLIHRSGGLCPPAVSRQISLFRTIWAVAFNVNNIEGEWWFNGQQRMCNYCYEFVGTKGVFEREIRKLYKVKLIQL